MAWIYPTENEEGVIVQYQKQDENGETLLGVSLSLQKFSYRDYTSHGLRMKVSISSIVGLMVGGWSL